LISISIFDVVNWERCRLNGFNTIRSEKKKNKKVQFLLFDGQFPNSALIKTIGVQSDPNLQLIQFF